MQKESRKNSPVIVYAVLHLSLILSSLSGVCSKMAGRQESTGGFLFWYGGVLVIMALYAVIWQQILKYLPLTQAYANKPVGLIWGMIWGRLFFGETITLKMILGSAVIFAGVLLVVTGDE